MTPASLSITSFVSGPAKRIHLIGVAGSGMSGLAGLLLALGHQVSGSDKVDTSEVRRLQSEGLIFHGLHQAFQAAEADIVVFSSAVKPGNPAYDEAIKLGKPLLRRAEALAAMMAERQGILVAGMHGKTTTSSMVAHVLRVGGLRPSHYVGAEIPILGTNAHWDSAGELFVAEGDESDGTVALFQPKYTILLNVEEEHLDYYRDLAAIEAVFSQLLGQTQTAIFYCYDDQNASRLCKGRIGSVSFGMNEGADYRFGEPRQQHFQSRFEVFKRGHLLGEAVLNVPGKHNASNATSVIALAMELGVDFQTAVYALESFRGARRRFEFKHQGQRFAVVDDYGHHPSEISATLATARAGHAGRIVTVFQPHRYTRTKALRERFGCAFGHSELVVVADVYPASETIIPGVSGQTIVDALLEQGHSNAIYEPNIRRLVCRVGAALKTGDLLISLGAGNVHEVTTQLVHDLAILEEILDLLGIEGTASLYEPLSKHTTLRVGGPARFWVEPQTELAFSRLVKFAAEKGLPVLVVGRGSNLLVRDGGFDGLVIHPSSGEFVSLKVDAAASEITAGAAVGLKRLTGAASKAGIGGFEWMDGIPGAVGGSLRMNAGAMGIETFSQVTSVRVLNRYGEIKELTPDQMEICYRNVPDLQQNYVLSATFRGRESTPEIIDNLLSVSSAKRRLSQPIAASAGCIFKNPSKEYPAGKLVQELGLKNTNVGAARVSEVHGNFIVNDGGATAADVLALIDQIKACAWKELGINITTEVQVIGQD